MFRVGGRGVVYVFFSFGLRLRFWGRADVLWWTTGVPNRAKQAGSTGAPAALGVEGP